MVNRPRAKGTSAESTVVDYLREHGWPYAERRALAGSLDLGDITGCPGLVWEVKYAGRSMRMGAWIEETIEERKNAKADHGILVIKPPRFGEKKIGQWLAVMVAWDFEALLDKFPYDWEQGPGVPAPLCALSDPAHYAQGTVLTDLAQFSATLPETIPPVLIRRPPGSKDQPANWYHITYLTHMVSLIRMAGYGTPSSV